MPQEGNATLGGHRKLMYARGADGRMKTVTSRGWDVEELVTRQAVDEFDRLAAQAWREAESGIASPLRYHMYRARMDDSLLAQATGLWRWQVRRHLRLARVDQLRPSVQQRYARALGLSVSALQALPEPFRAPEPAVVDTIDTAGEQAA